MRKSLRDLARDEEAAPAADGDEVVALKFWRRGGGMSNV